jgi:crossover junction endodeoxyribonuclease RusA
MKKIVLEGDPISTQHAYGSNGKHRFLTPAARSLKESYAWQAKSQWKGKPLTGRLEVTICLYFKDSRRRDWDNWHKLSMDALQGIVFEDDEQIDFAHVEKIRGAVSPALRYGSKNFERDNEVSASLPT